MNFKHFAQKATSGSTVLQGRAKIETDALISKYPDGITINDFDFLDSTDGGKYVVCCFLENPDEYFNGGKILTEMFTGIVAEFESLEEARSEYEKAPKEELIKVKLSYARSKKGNRYTRVDVVE